MKDQQVWDINIQHSIQFTLFIPRHGPYKHSLSYLLMEASNHNKLLCQALLWFIIRRNISSIQEAFSLVTC